jgi:hypothetical protein
MTIQDRTNLRSVYLYLVCLITLVMLIFAAVSAVRNAVGLLYPDPGAFAYEPVFGPEGQEEITDEQRDERAQAFQEAERRRSVIGLVGAGTMLGLAGPAYVYHWRRVQAELAPRPPVDDRAVVA